jgi:hypothetical protein
MTVDKNGNGWFAGDITCTDKDNKATYDVAKTLFGHSY